MGIPARYVEGYAIDYDQILSGELVDGADYADYYDGYSEIGETAYVKVDVTDADAHAWVEVYDPVIGWYPVDVTPSSSDDEDITNFGMSLQISWAATKVVPIRLQRMEMH